MQRAELAVTASAKDPEAVGGKEVPRVSSATEHCPGACVIVSAFSLPASSRMVRRAWRVSPGLASASRCTSTVPTLSVPEATRSHGLRGSTVAVHVQVSPAFTTKVAVGVGLPSPPAGSSAMRAESGASTLHPLCWLKTNSDVLSGEVTFRRPSRPGPGFFVTRIVRRCSPAASAGGSTICSIPGLSTAAVHVTRRCAATVTT